MFIVSDGPEILPDLARSSVLSTDSLYLKGFRKKNLIF